MSVKYRKANEGGKVTRRAELREPATTDNQNQDETIRPAKKQSAKRSKG